MTESDAESIFVATDTLTGESRIIVSADALERFRATMSAVGDNDQAAEIAAFLAAPPEVLLDGGVFYDVTDALPGGYLVWRDLLVESATGPSRRLN